MAAPQPSGRRRPLPTTTDGRLAEAERLKAEGNELFKQGLHKKARTRYNKVFAFTRGLSGGADGGTQDDQTKMAMAMAQKSGSELSEAQSERLTAVNVSAWLNLSACELKLAEPARAIAHCDNVLSVTGHDGSGDPAGWVG